MIKKFERVADRRQRHARVRTKISGTSLRPRLNVYKSTNEIYAQVIDDENGVTLVSANTREKSLQSVLNGKTKVEKALIIGQEIAKRAIDKKITNVVFDRGGYIYTGRVKSLAVGARDSGLVF